MKQVGIMALSEQTMPSPGLQWGQVIGLPVTVGTMASVSAEIIARARAGAGGQVCVANVHMLVTARSDERLRKVLEQAAMVVSDGTPLVWRLRRSGFREAGQVRGPDLMMQLCTEAAAAGLPVYFYGGDDRLMADLRVALEQHAPGLIVAGAEAAPVLPPCPALDPDIVARIRRSGARIVFVGLGCPKQEFWMAAHRPHLDAVLIGVGQAFGIAAGHLPEAPAWMRRSGLEWLFRLASEPRRLWRRYLVTNSLFLTYLLRELAGRRHQAEAPSR